jgi:hypothetical protein
VNKVITCTIAKWIATFKPSVASDICSVVTCGGVQTCVGLDRMIPFACEVIFCRTISTSKMINGMDVLYQVDLGVTDILELLNLLASYALP